MIRSVCVLVLLLGGVAVAHDLRPGVLAFVDDGNGELHVRFVPPIDSRGEAIDLALVLPDGCTRNGDRVRCKDGFGGELAVGGMRGHVMKIFVSLERDGKRRDWVLTSEQPRIDLGPAPPSSVHAWIREGVHAFPDVQVAFALALVLLLGVTRRLAWSLLALTLASAIAGLVGFVAPASIVALSLLLVTRAAATRSATLSWLAIGAFGVAHGLTSGASGAWFQVGVVFTRAIIVGLAVVVALVAKRLIGERGVVGVRAHRAAGYALGALATWWLLRALAGG